MNPVEAGTLSLEREFSAPPEKVFAAWTDPEVLRRWWAAGPAYTSPGCEVDLRVGGRYLLRMRDEDGNEHVVGGEFREIDPPARLVYTWQWVGEDVPDPGHESLVAVEFVPAGSGTLVRLDHSGLPSEESATRHGHGWNGVLDSLAARVFNQ
jgi:uncharacterized protein YndB with AHSA1/START domain